MRRAVLIAVASLSVVATACAQESSSTAAATSGGSMTAAECTDAHTGDLYGDGALTVGTGNPAYPPWWEGGTTDAHSDWEGNDPYLGKGFEGAVTFAIAQAMGFDTGQVEFVPVKFNQSYAPGDKSFDFVIQQIAYSESRAKAADFSDSYFDVTQAVVSTKGSPIDGATSLADLQDATLGSASGDRGYDYIVDQIQPTNDAKAYDDLNGAVNALKNGQIDGIVVDLPTAFYMSTVQVPDGIIVGQLPPAGEQDHFGVVLGQGNPLLECVNLAIAELKADGSLKQIEQEWISDRASAPVLSA
jgi:polar amino acid transport system substrate-binding protein